MALRATNLGHAKAINRWVVFDALRSHGPLSRAEIARLTGLSKQTVSNLADELCGAGLLRDGPRRTGAVGKPSVPLAINPDGGRSIGLQVDRGRLVALVADLAGEVLARHEARVAGTDPDVAVPLLREALARVLRAAGLRREAVLGLGLVMPGPFGVEGLGPTSLPGWDGPRIAAGLEAASGLPVLLENDATAAACAEWLYGAARSLRTFVYLFVGIGLGGGLILDGHPFGGAAGNSGEIGHVIVRPDGEPCHCGNRGCLEAYVSLTSLFGYLATEPPSALALGEPVEPGDERVEAWLRRAAGPLRLGLNALENLFDPETILLGGDAPRWLLERLGEAVIPLLGSIGSRGRRTLPRLQLATTGRDAAARGAAVLPILANLHPGYRPARDPDGRTALGGGPPRWVGVVPTRPAFPTPRGRWRVTQ